MNKEKVHKLADFLIVVDGDEFEEAITEWLEQNQSEPVVVGLSGEQIMSLKSYIVDSGANDSGDVEWAIRDWLKTQTFAQPQLTPSWDDAPSWANWLAQDSDGQWQWYNKKPVAEYGCWASHLGNYDSARGTIKNWQQTLQERPKPTPVIEVGQVWQYKGGSKYHIDSLGRMKFEPHTGWVDCVTFRKLEGSDAGQFFTRTLDDFMAKFVRVSDDN